MKRKRKKKKDWCFWMNQIDDILNLAKTQVGYEEDPNGYNKYNLEYYGKNSSQPWCVTFIWWLFKHINASNLFYGGNKTASCGTLFDYYAQRGLANKSWTPNPGDLVEFTFNGVAHCHIGICLSYDGKNVTTIDGNTSEVGSQEDGGHVLVRTRGRSTIYGVIRPQYKKDTKPEPTPVPEEVWYTVKKGDTLTKIAKKYGVTVDYLVELNNISNPNLIYSGQKIRIK